MEHVIEGKIEGRIKLKERRGKRGRQLTDDMKGKIAYRRLKEEELDGERSLEEAVDMSQTEYERNERKD